MIQNVEILHLINAAVLDAKVRFNLEGWYNESAEMAA
jgi:hypothetical protein